MRVIDFLESIHVDQEQCDLIFASRGFDEITQFDLQLKTVGKSGK